MTTMPPFTAPRPPIPGAVTLARVLVVVQVAIGLLAATMLGFIALLGLAWTAERDGRPTLAAFAMAAVFVLVVGTIITIACLAGRLRPGADNLRVALVAIESVVVVLMLALTAEAGSDRGLGPIAMVPTLYAACALGTIVALLQPAARTWCHPGFGATT